MHRIRLVERALAVVLALATAFAMAAPAPVAAPPDQDSAPKGNQVDINSATVEDLITVPGIGQAIAQRIVEFREKNGPYGSVDDLLKVQGIGQKSLAKIRAHLVASKPRK